MSPGGTSGPRCCLDCGPYLGFTLAPFRGPRSALAGTGHARRASPILSHGGAPPEAVRSEGTSIRRRDPDRETLGLPGGGLPGRGSRPATGVKGFVRLRPLGYAVTGFVLAQGSRTKPGGADRDRTVDLLNAIVLTQPA